MIKFPEAKFRCYYKEELRPLHILRHDLEELSVFVHSDMLAKRPKISNYARIGTAYRQQLPAGEYAYILIIDPDTQITNRNAHWLLTAPHIVNNADLDALANIVVSNPLPLPCLRGSNDHITHLTTRHTLEYLKSHIPSDLWGADETLYQHPAPDGSVFYSLKMNYACGLLADKGSCSRIIFLPFDIRSDGKETLLPPTDPMQTDGQQHQQQKQPRPRRKLSKATARTNSPQEAPRRRGRPKGSKNRPKQAA